MRVAQDLPKTCCVNICTFIKKSFCLVMFHRPLIDVTDFPHSALLHGHQRRPHTYSRQTSATPHRGLLFGPLAEYNALSCEPNSWVEVRSEQTPIHYSSNEHGFYTRSGHDDSRSVANPLAKRRRLWQASGNRCVVVSPF